MNKIEVICATAISFAAIGLVVIGLKNTADDSRKHHADAESIASSAIRGAKGRTVRSIDRDQYGGVITIRFTEGPSIVFTAYKYPIKISHP